SNTNYFLGSDRQMQQRVETWATDNQLNNEYAESSTKHQDKRCSHNISIYDEKLSKYLCERKGRIYHDHAQAATSSAMKSNANNSADIDAEDSSNSIE
ncbi:hypothetical protein ACJMK2_029450, partial [Sinanodonta woodiana]